MKCCPKYPPQEDTTQRPNLNLRGNPDTKANCYMINMYWLRLNETSRDVHESLERI